MVVILRTEIRIKIKIEIKQQCLARRDNNIKNIAKHRYFKEKIPQVICYY